MNFSLGALISPVVSVAYTAFSRLKASREDLKKSYLHLLELVAMIVIPACIGIAIIADPMVQLIYPGEEWSDLSRIIMVLAIFPGLSFIFILNSELYRAVGKPELMPKILLFGLIYSIPAYILAARMGLFEFALARFSVGFLFFPVHAYFAYKELQLEKSYLWKVSRAPLASSFAMGALCLLSIDMFEPFTGMTGAVKLGVIIVGAVFVYSGAMFLIKRDRMLKMAALVKQSLLPAKMRNTYEA